jgi:hypothetical protein
MQADLLLQVAIVSLVVLVVALIFRPAFLLHVTQDAPGQPRRAWARRLYNGFVVLVSLLMIVGFVSYIVPNTVEDASLRAGMDLVSLEVSNAPARTVLAQCARQFKGVLAIDKSIQGNITIDAQSVRLSDAMDQICAQLDCVWEVIPGEKPALFVRSRASTANAAGR